MTGAGLEQLRARAQVNDSFICMGRIRKKRVIDNKLLSQSCHNRLPQTWWLQTTEIYALAAWRPESQNQGVHRQGQTLSSLWWLLAFLGLWPRHSNLSLHYYTFNSVFFSSVCLKSPSAFLFQGHMLLEFNSPPPENPGRSLHLKILNFMCKDLLPNKVTFTDSRDQKMNISFGDHHSNHYKALSPQIQKSFF